MANDQKNEPIWYHEYDPVENDTPGYRGVIRVVVNVSKNATQHLRIDDPEAPGGKRNINNVQNEEEFVVGGTDKQTYWRRAVAGWIP